jgi:guanosine-3',5'-bis(diphosphate) 3'-pyrophosphohydrolase
MKKPISAIAIAADKHRNQRRKDHEASPYINHPINLANILANERDISSSPPADWPLIRKQEYFDWAKSVVDGLRGVHPELERVFDEAYKLRPEA